MAKFHQPCPCGKSSDAYAYYDDGNEKCFSCKKFIFNKDKMADLKVTMQYLPFRGLTEATVRKYDIKTFVDAQDSPHHWDFPYPNGAEKHNLIADKQFWSSGEISKAGCFGIDKFEPGGKAITITEGEKDAPSVYQMFGSKYAAVSVQSSSSARRDCTVDRDKLNSFDRIYLCFDNDEPGQKAVREVAALFDFNKVYHVKLTKHKDANDYLQNGDVEAFKQTWWAAKRFMPDNVLSQFSEFDKAIDESETRVGFPIPFPTLQEMTDGLRTGESYLVTALEGVGKTEILRAMEFAILSGSTDNVGVLHIEERKDDYLKRLAGLELGVPAHFRESAVSQEEIKAAYRRVIKTEDRLHLYSHYGSDDPDILIDLVRFLVVACKCKYVFFDHISMAVSGLKTDDSNKALDYLSTRLETLVKELDFCLVFVSHVNDDGLTRGSRNISKVADTWIHIERNATDENEFSRNLAYVTINKNRPRAKTGPAGKLLFDPKTFSLREWKDKELPV